MIVQGRGGRVVSVIPDFRPHALTEIAFRPDGAHSEDQETFDARMEVVREVLLSGEADGPVQATAEATALEHLASGLRDLVDALGPGELIRIESEPATDWPKTRERRQDVVVAGENKFHFHWRIDPPLRVSVCRPRHTSVP